MRIVPAVIMGAAGLVAICARANAQDDAAIRRGCFRGRPGGQCAWFPLVETGVHFRLTEVVPEDEHVMVNWSLGVMKNQGPRVALGAGLFASVEGEFRAGATLRWRRWIGPGASLDLATGVHLAGEASSGKVRAGSPTLQARINAGDYIAATARLDLLSIAGSCDPPPAACPSTPRHASRRFYAGVELGSWPGLAGYAATAVLIVVALIAFSRTYAVD